MRARERLTDAQRDLITDCLEMAAKKARLWTSRGIVRDRNEALSLAYLGLARAAQLYRPDRGEFGPWAWSVMDFARCDETRREFGRRGQRKPPPTLAREHGTTEPSVNDTGAAEVDWLDFLEHLLRPVVGRDRMILEGIARGDTQQEIAARTGLSQPGISLRISRMRTYLAGVLGVPA
jgi:DNA-directed RNA polymerase specialized sigma24 family protein